MIQHVILWGCSLCSSSGEERYGIDERVYLTQIQRDIKEAHAAAKFDCPFALDDRFAFTISVDSVEVEG